MSLGKAKAWGAVSVVNGIATGEGASLAVGLATTATVELLEETDAIEVVISPDHGEDTTLAREVIRRVCDRAGVAHGARVETVSDIPVSRGLKSSSAAANAVALAANEALKILEGRGLPERDLLDCAIDAALAAKVTITGAFDDATASLYGGLSVTDNRGRKVYARHAPPPDHVAVVRIPDRKVRTLAVRDLAYEAIAPVARRAHALARANEWAEAMTLNGLAYGALYGLDPAPVLAALAAGARGASVSGTGPAIAAVAPTSKSEAVARALGQGGARVVTVPLVATKAEVIPC